MNNFFICLYRASPQRLFLLLATVIIILTLGLWYWVRHVTNSANNHAGASEAVLEDADFPHEEPYRYFFEKPQDLSLAACIWNNDRDCLQRFAATVNYSAFIGKTFGGSKANVEHQEEYNRMSLLDFAVYLVLEYNHSTNIVRYLLQLPNKPGFRPDGSAPYSVQAASRIGNIELVRMLVDAGVSPHANHSEQAYPILLERAVELEDKELVEEIVRRGCNINGKQITGWTLPLECMYYKKWDFVLYFLRHGANPKTQTPNGITFLSLLEQQKKDFDRTGESYPEQFEALLRWFSRVSS